MKLLNFRCNRLLSALLVISITATASNYDLEVVWRVRSRFEIQWPMATHRTITPEVKTWSGRNGSVVCYFITRAQRVQKTKVILIRPRWPDSGENHRSGERGIVTRTRVCRTDYSSSSSRRRRLNLVGHKLHKKRLVEREQSVYLDSDLKMTLN